jgi:hypothetical protein
MAFYQQSAQRRSRCCSEMEVETRRGGGKMKTMKAKAPMQTEA